MKIKYNIKCFRSIVENQELELYSNKINVIFGTNGSGKSNILDAIRWFSGADVKNVNSRKTIFHPEFNSYNLYMDFPEISYTDELDDDEKWNIFNELEQIGVEYSNNNLHRYFIQYKDLYYKDLDVCKEGLTDFAKIKAAIILKFNDYWPLGIFTQEENSQYKFKYWKMKTNIEDAKKEINSSNENELNAEIKNLLCKAIDVLNKIDSIFKVKPNIFFSCDLESDNDILFEYPIQSVKNLNNIDPTFEAILNVIGGEDTINTISQIIDLSTSETNRPAIKDLKNKLEIKAEECFKNIFKNFTINMIPKISIDDNMFQIVIKFNKKRYYGTTETGQQSSGFKAFLWLIIMLEIVKVWDATRFGRVILMIDEPDKSLHILLQYELAKYLKMNFTNQNNIFILITSHSPFLIPDLKENIYIAEVNERGCTNIIKAENINDIRNAGIFPLITLFQMEKFRDEFLIDLNENNTRIYYKDTKNNDNNKKIASFIKNIFQNKFDYQLISTTNEESKHLLEIKTNDFFSRHIYEKEHLYELIKNNFHEHEKDIYLSDKLIKSILSEDILDSK